MTVRTRAQLNSDAGTYLADNTTGDITPDDVRQRVKDLADSAVLPEDYLGISAATAKTTPVDADLVGIIDSAASNVLKKVTWANIKATLKTYFDTLYQPFLATLASWGAITRASGVDTLMASFTSANLRAALTDESGTGVALFAGTPGTNIANTPAGNIAATTVQAAINELDSEKQPLNSNLSTIAGLTPTTDNFIVAVASAWASRTAAQVLATLAAVGTTFQPLAAALTSWASISRASGVDTLMASFTSANLRAALTDETGTGSAVFANSPTLVTPALGTPASGALDNCTGVKPKSSGIVNVTAGSTVDITSIPAGVNLIVIAFEGISTNGTGALGFQIGDSGGIENTGYVSAAFGGGGTSTTQFLLRGSVTAANTYSGTVNLVLMDAATNKWAFSLVGADSAAGALAASGVKSLSGTLDRIRILTTDTFDGSGTFSASYFS